MWHVMFTFKKCKLSWVSVPDFGSVGGGAFSNGWFYVIRDTHILCIFPLTQICTTFSVLYPLSIVLIPFLELLY